jgi:hypothetical protein
MHRSATAVYMDFCHVLQQSNKMRSLTKSVSVDGNLLIATKFNYCYVRHITRLQEGCALSIIVYAEKSCYYLRTHDTQPLLTLLAVACSCI